MQLLEAVGAIKNDVEANLKCEIILAGVWGSQAIGLGGKASDYDIIALQKGCSNAFIRTEKMVIGNIEMEMHIWNVDMVFNELKKWHMLDIPVPTILSKSANELIHDDRARSVVRLACANCVINQVPITGMREGCDLNEGLLISDALDYEYSRAYMNYNNALNGTSVNVRKYLYTLNELFTIQWIIDNHSFAPKFRELLHYMKVSDIVCNSIIRLLNVNENHPKQSGCIVKDDILNSYIGEELIRLRDLISGYTNAKSTLRIRYYDN